MGTNLARVERESDAVHWLNRIEIDAETLIAELPRFDDEVVMEIRVQASSLGKMAWRVQWAADAEIMKRIENRTARGPHDEEGKRIAKAIREQAAAAGVTERTIRRNSQGMSVFFSTDINVRRQLEGIEVLENPTFLYLALETENPVETAAMFIERKTADARFDTGDAARLVKEGKAPNLHDTFRAALDTKGREQAYQEWRAATLALARAIPEWRGTLRGYVEELEYEAARPSETWRARILEKIAAGSNTVELLSRELGRDRIEVQVMLNRLVEDDTLERRKQERAPGARGAAQMEYYVRGVEQPRATILDILDDDK